MYTERAVRRTYDARNERAARTMATFIISLCAILMLTTVSGLISVSYTHLTLPTKLEV